MLSLFYTQYPIKRFCLKCRGPGVDIDYWHHDHAAEVSIKLGMPSVLNAGLSANKIALYWKLFSSQRGINEEMPGFLGNSPLTLWRLSLGQTRCQVAEEYEPNYHNTKSRPEVHL